MVLFLSNPFTSSSSHTHEPIQPVPVNLYYYHFRALMQIVNNTIPPGLVVPFHASNLLYIKYILEIVYYFADLVPFKDSEVVLDMADRPPFARVIWVLPRGFQFPIEYGQQVVIPFLGAFWIDQFLEVDNQVRDYIWFQIGGIHMGNFDRLVPLVFLGVPFKSKHFPWMCIFLLCIFIPMSIKYAPLSRCVGSSRRDLAHGEAEQPSELDRDHKYRIM
jgi:hypothetical protein